MVCLNPEHESVKELRSGKGCQLGLARYRDYAVEALVFRHIAEWCGRTVEREFVISTVEGPEHLDRLVRHSLPMLDKEYHGSYVQGVYE
jgi:hypothetical protein